jgi:hypothetical protein
MRTLRHVARDAGVSLRRTQSLNTSPAFIRALAQMVKESVATPTDDYRLPTDDYRLPTAA